MHENRVADAAGYLRGSTVESGFHMIRHPVRYQDLFGKRVAYDSVQNNCEIWFILLNISNSNTR